MLRLLMAPDPWPPCLPCFPGVLLLLTDTEEEDGAGDGVPASWAPVYHS